MKLIHRETGKVGTGPKLPRTEFTKTQDYFRLADHPTRTEELCGRRLRTASMRLLDEIVLSLSDGMILSATMDNRVQTIERECPDSSVTQCGEPKPHFISRQVEIYLKR